VAVLYSYFDDSGTDGASPAAIMAGYVAHMADWKKFERQTGTLFESEGIQPFFRAKLFDHNQKQFKGWTEDRKLAFARRWYGLAKKHLMRGVSAGVVKSDFIAGRAINRKIPVPSTPAYCLQLALINLCADGAVWREIEKYGLYLVVETSSPSVDAGIRDTFGGIVGINRLEKHLRSIAFAKKDHSRALQLADYLAYYSHRFALTAMHDSHEGHSEFLDIAQSNVTTIMRLGHRFKPNPDFIPPLREWRRRRRKEAGNTRG
jgi:Protein of unknown function (DUF3800)